MGSDCLMKEPKGGPCGVRLVENEWISHVNGWHDTKVSQWNPSISKQTNPAKGHLSQHVLGVSSCHFVSQRNSHCYLQRETALGRSVGLDHHTLRGAYHIVASKMYLSNGFISHALFT